MVAVTECLKFRAFVLIRKFKNTCAKSYNIPNWGFQQHTVLPHCCHYLLVEQPLALAPLHSEKSGKNKNHLVDEAMVLL
jgi:hypothetical protein